MFGYEVRVLFVEEKNVLSSSHVTRRTEDLELFFRLPTSFVGRRI